MDGIKAGELAAILGRFAGQREQIIPITARERRIMENWLAVDEENQQLFERIKQDPSIDQIELYEIDAEFRSWRKLEKKVRSQPWSTSVFKVKWVAAAALLIGVMVTGLTLRISPVSCELYPSV